MPIATALAVYCPIGGLTPTEGTDTAVRAVSLLIAALLITSSGTACGQSGGSDLSPPDEPWSERREMMYPWLRAGDTATADLIREGIWDLPRFDPIELAYPPTWTEDPYEEPYWRFIFYGLRPLKHLLSAYDETGDLVYLETLADLLESFALRRAASPYVDDPHAAAFRTMVQVASYGTLSRAGLLDDDLEKVMRASIATDARFLADPLNFEGGYNHGFTEAAALLLVAETFPDTGDWGDLARSRLDRVMVDAVDIDGVEVENSPFYHFYVMRFSADIAAWADRNAVGLPDTFSQRLENMTDYAAWIVMPDSRVPLLGSSVTRIADTASTVELADLAAKHPHLEFVLSRGAEGAAPNENHKLFPESGTSILRSGFGTEETFWQQTHIIFDVGPYRTNHSQLDALSLNIHAAGLTLLPDSGLFSYESGPDFDYFHGTAAHNTVLVNGQDQLEGAATAGLSTGGDFWSYQSGRHELYPGVVHRRGVALIGRDLVAVVDLLEASQSSEFVQLWHFAPELDARIEAGTVIAAADAGDVVAIYQAGDGRTPTVGAGDDGAHPGWHSASYEIKVPSAVAGYAEQGNTARYLTLLAFGPAAQSEAVVFEAARSGDGLELTICGPDTALTLAIDDLAGPSESVTVAAADCEASR